VSKEKIGFIGLGNMGKPMAETLLRKGFDIWVNDLCEEPVTELERLGAKSAKLAKEIGTLCDIIIVMVRNTAQTEALILGRDGILEGAKEGSLILLMNTVEPNFCQRIARIVAEKKVSLLDAPVSGAPEGARAGTLTIIVGGEEALLGKCRHVLEAMGKNIFHVGGIGTGQVVKLVNNLAFYVNSSAVAEATALGTKAGVELERLLEVLTVSTGNSWAAQNWPSYRERKVREGDHIKSSYDVMRVIKSVAKDMGLHLPLLEFISQQDRLEVLKGTAFHSKMTNSEGK